MRLLFFGLILFGLEESIIHGLVFRDGGSQGSEHASCLKWKRRRCSNMGQIFVSVNICVRDFCSLLRFVTIEALFALNSVDTWSEAELEDVANTDADEENLVGHVGV